MKLSKYHVVTPSVVDRDSHQRFRVLFSTRSTERVLVGEALWHQLATGRTEDLEPEVAAELAALSLLVPDDEDELAAVIADNDAAAHDNESLRVVVQPTASCQLGCGYCGQEHTPDRLSADAQRRVVERARRNLESGRYTEMNVGWFGAEPLLGLSVIRTLSPQLQDLAAEHGCSYRATVVTNGLLLTPEVARELESQHQVRQVEITLDGTEAVHDTRRTWKSGAASFRRIFSNLCAVARCDDLSMAIIVRCNVDRENFADVPALIDLLAAEGLQQRVVFYAAPVHDWGNDAHLGAFTTTDFATLEAGWLRQMVRVGFAPNVIPGRKKVVCLAVERDGELVDAYGNLFSCTEVSYVPTYGTPNRYALGHVDTGTFPGRRNLLADFNRRIEQRTVPCADCRMLPVCGGACPKAWLDGNAPCPAPKFNIADRLLLDLAMRSADEHIEHIEHAEHAERVGSR